MSEEKKQIFVYPGYHELHSNEPYEGSGFWNGDITFWSMSCSCCSSDTQMTYEEALDFLDEEIEKLLKFKEQLRRRISAKQMST